MRVLISSLHFSPAFIGHMKAWYGLCELTGHEPLLYFSQSYAPYFDKTYKQTTNADSVRSFSPDYAIIQNIGFEHLSLFKMCRSIACRTLYILHEPFPGIRETLKEGRRVPRSLVASALNIKLCNLADKVVICSDFAETNCKRYMPGAAAKILRMPLLFTDDYDELQNIPREYFSYIGTWTASHAADVFLNYVHESYDSGDNTKFLITTRSDISSYLDDAVFRRMQDTGQLTIQQGRPLTEAEMGEAYRRSIAVWNGYRKSTQSGVLPNAYMHGTPVLASSLPAFKEFVVPGQTGMIIDIDDYESINRSFCYIRDHQRIFGTGCREFFLSKFNYSAQEEAFAQLLAAT